MKTIEELEKAVIAYAEKHGYGPLKMYSYYPDKLYYSYTDINYYKLEGQIITMKNGKTRVVFKVDGKVASIYK
jgi:hypothetical protein